MSDPPMCSTNACSQFRFLVEALGSHAVATKDGWQDDKHNNNDRTNPIRNYCVGYEHEKDSTLGSMEQLRYMTCGSYDTHCVDKCITTFVCLSVDLSLSLSLTLSEIYAMLFIFIYLLGETSL